MKKNLTRARLRAPGRLVNALRRALLAALAATPLGAPAQAPVPPLKVGFVYVTPVGQAGWSYQHDLGRQAMERALGAQVKSTVVEAVAEGPDAERVMRDMAQQGHGLIFATSFGYLDSALRVAAEFPGVRFEHAGGYKSAPNLNTYNARIYESRWLAGRLAALNSRSGVAGYVAGFPVPEVVQGINAFALGMRSVNPKAEVRVLWLQSWFDPPREREAALTLVNQGADVLTNHTASPAVALAAEELGVKLIANQSDMSRFAPKAQLAAVTYHWGDHYTSAARAVIAGSWKPRPVWGGIADGMTDLSALNAALPAAQAAAIDSARRDLRARRAAVFAAPLVDNSGRARLAQGALGDDAIAAMDWFVQGVVSGVPVR
jgi:simple sugar transport system substrate-binding protein